MNIELTTDEVKFLTAALTSVRRGLIRRHKETLELVDIANRLGGILGEEMPQDIQEAKRRYLKAYNRDALLIDGMLNKFRSDTDERQVSLSSVRKIHERDPITVVEFENGMEVCSDVGHRYCKDEDYLSQLPTIHVFDNERDA